MTDVGRPKHVKVSQLVEDMSDCLPLTEIEPKIVLLMVKLQRCNNQNLDWNRPDSILGNQYIDYLPAGLSTFWLVSWFCVIGRALCTSSVAFCAWTSEVFARLVWKVPSHWRWPSLLPRKRNFCQVSTCWSRTSKTRLYRSEWHEPTWRYISYHNWQMILWNTLRYFLWINISILFMINPHIGWLQAFFRWLQRVQMCECWKRNQNIDWRSLYGQCSAHFDHVTIKILIYQYFDCLPAVCPTELCKCYSDRINIRTVVFSASDFSMEQVSAKSERWGCDFDPPTCRSVLERPWGQIHGKY